MSSFPKHVDSIIIGTGLTNSILAAACSRIGKSVLHLDENSYYGNYDASFTFQQLVDWIKLKYPTNPSLESIPEEILHKSRLFCIDLSPRFLFSNGDMVDLLVKSNVARYHEFKNNIRILCLTQDEIHVMPCRRNEVFTSPLLSNLADKRRLMKFIEMCVGYHDSNKSLTTSGDHVSEIDKHGNKPIDEFLDESGLNPTLKGYIINSIAMIRPTDTTKEACRRIKRFMVATEKYGRSPFLFPLYGCGEFSQSFCRLSAVFGGIYCLNTRIEKAEYKPVSTLADGNKLRGGEFVVKFGVEHEVTSDLLVVDHQDAIKLDLRKNSDNESCLSRAILITNKSIVPSSNGEEDHTQVNDLISFLRVPPTIGRNNNTIYLIELNSSALVCPKDMNIVYMWTKSTGGDAETDLKPTVERLFCKPELSTATGDSCILWKFYYHQVSKFSQFENQETNPMKISSIDDEDDNTDLFVTNPLFDDIDYSSVIHEAERLFKRMCPDQEFLPRAPDPDEIIHSA